MWQRSSKTKDAFFFPPLEKKKRGLEISKITSLALWLVPFMKTLVCLHSPDVEMLEAPCLEL